MRLLQGPVLPPNVEARLRQRSTRHEYGKHELICTADSTEDFFFIVTEGSLRVFFSHISGREFSLATLEPGSLFTSHAGLNIEALQDSTIEVVDASLIRDIMKEDVRFSGYLIGVIAEVLGTSLQCIESLVFENLECRLAQYLLEQVRPKLEKQRHTHVVHTDWTSHIAEADAQRQSIELKHDLSVEEIAKFVGSSRQSVSLLLSNWQREGVISHRHRRIAIDDVNLLRSIAYPSK